MTIDEWKKYYIDMVYQGIRPEKRKEMVANCGGLLCEKDELGKSREETQVEAEERLIGEILELRKQIRKEA